MNANSAFLRAFDLLPVGGYGGTFQGKRYRITKRQMSNGRSQKLEAEELGGPDYVSFNLYRLATGQVLLKPCEMAEDKVVEFVLGVIVDE
ncbi:MAG: hypothetical protein ACR2OY_02885 [Boseongicola sp.]